MYILINNPDYQSDYQTFLENFTTHIIDTVKATNFSPSIFPRGITIDDFPNAFNDAHKIFRKSIPELSITEDNFNDPTTDLTNHSSLKGYIYFVYVAGKRAEIKTIKLNVDQYNEEGGYDWKPYAPDIDEIIGLIMRWQARNSGFNSGEFLCDANLINELLNLKSKIVIIIVDPWTLRLTNHIYKKIMMELDKQHFYNCGVLIVMNKKDKETNEKFHELNDIVSHTFQRSTCKQPNCFVSNICSINHLREEISKMIICLQNNIFAAYENANKYRKMRLLH